MKKIFLLGLISCASFYSFAAVPKLDNEKVAENVLKPEDEKPAEAHVSDSLNKSKLEIEMRMDFLAGIRHQNHLTRYEKFLSHENKRIAFDSEAGIKLIYTNELENFSYGGVVLLTPTHQIATSSSFNGTHIFFITEYGIVKVGSPNDAGSDMRITGGDKTVGGYWKSFLLIDTEHLRHNELSPEFEKGNSYLVSSYKTKLFQYNDGTEFARKISFLTPEVQEGFRFGISYTPDSRNTGGSGFLRNPKSETGIKKYNIGNNQIWRINNNVKNALSLGISYRHIFDEITSAEIALTSEFAKASGAAQRIENNDGKDNRKILESAKLKNLRTYNIGGNLNIGNICYSLSFGSLGKSLTSGVFNLNGRNTKYFNAGITYGQGPLKTSIEYFRSNKYKNILESISLGTEYKVAPGLSPFIEFTHLRAKGKPSYYPIAANKKIRGNALILGLKLRVKL